MLRIHFIQHWFNLAGCKAANPFRLLRRRSLPSLRGPRELVQIELESVIGASGMRSCQTRCYGASASLVRRDSS